MGIWTKIAGSWQEIAAPPAAAPLWAVCTGGTETTFVGNGTNGVSGKTYKVHSFPSNGNLVVTRGGKLEVFLISGGGSTNGSQTYKGGGGRVLLAETTVVPGTLPVVIGAGGVGRASTMMECIGKPSSLGGLSTGYAPSGDPPSANGPLSGAVDLATFSNPLTTLFDGTSKEYGRRTANGVTGRANSGDAAQWDQTQHAGTGFVQVRYQMD